MLTKLSTLALALPLVSAFSFNTVSDGSNGASLTVTWTADTSDPPYISFELLNPTFHNTYAVANNIQTALGTYTFEIPQVPDSDYTIEAIAPNNIQQVYATSNTFSIGAPSSSTASGSSSASTTGTLSMLSLSSTSTSTGSSTTPTASFTSPVSSSSVASVASSSSSTSASSTPSSFGSSGAASFKFVGVAPAAALLLSAVAGAVMVF